VEGRAAPARARSIDELSASTSGRAWARSIRWSWCTTATAAVNRFRLVSARDRGTSTGPRRDGASPSNCWNAAVTLSTLIVTLANLLLTDVTLNVTLPGHGVEGDSPTTTHPIEDASVLTRVMQ